MASATTRPLFSFFHNLHPTKPSCKPHYLPIPKLPINSSLSLHKIHSVEVSQEDKPLEQSDKGIEEGELETQTQNIDPRRLEEKFAVLNTGIYECRSCGYRYDESAGDPSYPIPAGLPFAKLPEDWFCPTCGAAQSFFVSKSVEVAGFAQNQQFGLGGNTLTSGQKALLIYGSLLLAFALFLSGYFLQ